MFDISRFGNIGLSLFWIHLYIWLSVRIVFISYLVGIEATIFACFLLCFASLNRKMLNSSPLTPVPRFSKNSPSSRNAVRYYDDDDINAENNSSTFSNAADLLYVQQQKWNPDSEEKSARTQ